ncbi:ABC transporter substrate-binding protein [Bradyrhizobium liaoningense]|uniref:ABC transporter substrate-binding protein n=1 Tax=Bradyrhizobium liaoningense TaxID=43992 RepID=UPI001BA45CC1|nr:ABC transporter substrate-binding protein [Bradyrhizobium liaoningense]MBR0717936.1 ABC transporter substrate-binding protein [Bradyrhizobium liaoningense]
MKRREFVSVLAGGAVVAAVPNRLRGAEKTYLIGFLGIAPAGRVFADRLKELGYFEGRSLKIELRFTEGKSELLPGMAADLVRLNPDVIVAVTGEYGLAVQKATRTIPIVVIFSHDGVGSGLYKSLAHPGGNITGYETMSPELDVKRVEIMKEVLPQLSRMTVIGNPTVPGGNIHFETISAAAEKLKIAVRFVEYRRIADVDAAFEAILNTPPEALLTVSDGVITTIGKRLADFGLEHRIPIFHEFKFFVELGGLLSYGPDVREIFQRGADYVDKILKGEKPGEIPVEQPTKFHLAINLKTAKTLGITIPSNLLVSANAVIE